MLMQESQIDQIIRRVLEKMEDERVPQPVGGLRGVFATADEALNAAQKAQLAFNKVSMAKRKAIIDAIRSTCIQHSQSLAQMVVEETKMGRVPDKVLKHLLIAEKAPGVEDLPSRAYVGDDGLTVEECAPFGTILAITPTTNPTATIFNNTINMLSAGNTVFFAPHPRALKSSLASVNLINEAIEEAGGPANLVVAMQDASIGAVQALMKHPKIAIICATGGPGVVDAALSSGKRAIGAAAGNPPVLVDDTADPVKAAHDIILGHSFDNNMPCTSEKEVIVTAGIADALMSAFKSADNCVVLGQQYLARLEQVALKPDKSGPNPLYIGKNAGVILKELGIDVPETVRAIIIEVDAAHPFVRHELMMPVLGVVRVGTFEEAIELAVEVEGGLHHSAIIHSSNIYHMSEFGKAINTTIFVKNAPSYAGLGYGGEGPTSFTLAGRTGEGVTTTRTFVRLRRCSLVGAFSAV